MSSIKTHAPGSISRNPVAAAAAASAEPVFIDLSRTTLFSLCQHSIVNRLERYPPDAFLDLTDLYDFESLIRLKHSKTKPKEGSGGLDGSGRVAPAIRAEYMLEVEASCPHLATSTVVDQLVWKDCVEFRFKRGGMTRPRALLLPWPLLVEQIQDAGQELLEAESLEDATAEACIHTLETSPMNISLLQCTGIGKTVKKVLKRNHGTPQVPEQDKLERLLNAWKDLAARNGVVSGAARSSVASDNAYDGEADDLELVESCKTWRQLFAVLKHREDERRSDLGKGMRERRKHLASDRPRIVKVRPTIAKREHILNRVSVGSSSATQPQKTKISQLRKESFQVALQTRKPTVILKQAPTAAHATAAPRAAGSFGAAVAFAASYNKNSSGKSRSKGSHVHLAGGKSMNVPTNVAKKATMARKWKSGRKPV